MRSRAFLAVLAFALTAGLAFSGAQLLFAEETPAEPAVEEPAVSPAEQEGEAGEPGETGGGGTEGTEGTEGAEAPADPAPEESAPGADGEPGESTESTEDGATGEEEPAAVVEGDAAIETGDAASDFAAGTEENTNDTASDVPEGSETNVENDNTAAADTSAAVSAETGANAAAGTGSATVDTGNAMASANVVNVVNTNIFNSEGLMYFLNVLMGNVSTDLRNIFSVLTGAEPAPGGCSLEECANGDTALNVTNNNSAEVNNNVAVAASTGGNTAAAGAGNATISTGNAMASANVVNVVNTNITDAQYLLLSVNSMGNGSGDIIFPGADWFYDLLKQGSGVPAGSSNTFINNNTAAVSNNGAVVANTGDNTGEGDGATVSTGNATAAATVVNQVNTNVFGDSLLFLFRVHGDWSGNVFGLPEGMSWRETGNGIELFFDGDTVSAPGGSTDRLTVTNNNEAVVNNNVSVFALTGGNYASSEGGSTTIETGNAAASANIVNVVNTNVLGRNWVLAIFNIFGDWSGNIAFGQPDLWVGARALTNGNLYGGSCFIYEVTVSNLGDADATNVVLTGLYSQIQQRIEEFQRELDGNMRLHMGRIAAGTAQTVTLPVCLSSYVPSGKEIVTEFEADSDENDGDESNNSEAISVVTMARAGGALRLGPAELEITKTVSDEAIRASSSVEYTIVIENKGDPVYHALLVDTIYGPNGKAIHEQRWGLDTILAGETIIVSYEAFFNGDTKPGTYTNEAFVSGVDRNPDYETNLGNRVDSPIAAVEMQVVEGNVQPKACEQLLYAYLRNGADNDVNEVSKLQYFLNTVEGENGLAMTGLFDPETEDAVRRFQEKYADEVLTPWGILGSTGYVYYTTQKKINEIWCGDHAYPLTDTQLAEIESFKNRVRAFEAAGIELPERELREVGQAPAEVSNALAVAGTPRREDEAANDQTATVLQSEAADGIWNSIRNTFTGIWNWFVIQ